MLFQSEQSVAAAQHSVDLTGSLSEGQLPDATERLTNSSLHCSFPETFVSEPHTEGTYLSMVSLRADFSTAD